MNRIINEGLDKLEKELLALPKDLRDEAVAFVRRSAEAAAADIRAAYPEGPTGNLRRGVKVTYGDRGRSTIYRYACTVVSSAPHAWIFERGTKERAIKTPLDWPASNWGMKRGRMPAGYVFEPRAERHRQRMESEIASMLARRGFRVIRRAA